MFSILFHCAMVPAKKMSRSSPQLEKASFPMLVTVAGMVTLFRPEPSKAELPMLVTPDGMATLVRLVQ